MVEYVDQVNDVYVSKECVYVSKRVSPYHHPIYIYIYDLSFAHDWLHEINQNMLSTSK